jgi:vesicle-fusing ATPase
MHITLVKIIKYISSKTLLKINKSDYIENAFDDIYKSKSSTIIFDDIDRMMDFSPIGLSYSNSILQLFMILLKGDEEKIIENKNKSIFVIVTCHSTAYDFFKETGLIELFNIIHNIELEY